MSENQLEKKLKAISKLKGMSIRQLCLKIGMTENGLSASLKKSTIKFSKLVEISEVLGISPSFFIFKIDSNLPDSEIQRLAEIAIKLKDNFPMVREANSPYTLRGAILFYEKNSEFINAEDFIGDLIVAAKSDEGSIPLIIEKWKRKITLLKKTL
ncbi:MAG TPA: helix-turn-helix transcriptional regulator [Bacteroidia bacterium]